MKKPTASDFIYLASQSPRRGQLLDQLGVRWQPLLPDDTEAAEALEAVQSDEEPAAYAQRVTGLKLDAAVQRLTHRQWSSAPILCADTTVALGARILGKPRDEADARQMLIALAGGTHDVITALALQHGAQRWQALNHSRVRFAALDAPQIQRYLDGGEWRGRAGAYGIQGRAAAFVAHLDGSYSGVMGLPLHETARVLQQAGFRFS